MSRKRMTTKEANPTKTWILLTIVVFLAIMPVALMIEAAHASLDVSFWLLIPPAAVMLLGLTWAAVFSHRDKGASGAARQAFDFALWITAGIFPGVILYALVVHGPGWPWWSGIPVVLIYAIAPAYILLTRE